jgi:signal transduction histidine kinase
VVDEPTAVAPLDGDTPDGEGDETFAQQICDLLFDISQESFTLDDTAIEAEPNVGRRAVFTGLLMLNDELRFQNEQRSLAEAQLRHREARMRALIDLAKVAIWDCSIEGVRAAITTFRTKSNGRPFDQQPEIVRSITRRLEIHGINREGLRMIGASTVEEVKAHIDGIAGADDGRLFGALWRALAEGEKRVEIEGVLHTLTGDRLTVLAGLSLPEGDVDQDVAIITLADITAHHARVAAEQEAARRTEELARVNSEVERLFYAVAHDLRSPLRAVETLAGWIGEDLEAGDVDEVRNHIATLRGRIERLDRMLNDLLSYARIGRTQHPIELVDVDKLLDEIRGGLLQIPEGFSLTWSKMPSIRTHRTLLSQVFLNLISNALKHHDRETGKVHVDVEDAGRHYVFRVTDDGPGIAPNYRQRIFGLFATLKRRDEVEGSGMGLAFVQKVVRRMGGQVGVEDPAESLSGEGSAEPSGRGITFAFEWPKRTVTPVEPDAQEARDRSS